MKDSLSQEEFARQLKISGHTYKEIGQMIGVSRQRIQDILKIKDGVSLSANCQFCGKNSDVLHKHHLNYETNEFQILCPSCHTKVHFPKMKTPIKKRGVGRPKIGKQNAKGELFAVRVTPMEAKAINATIRSSGLKRPDWLRKALLSASGGGIVAL